MSQNLNDFEFYGNNYFTQGNVPKYTPKHKLFITLYIHFAPKENVRKFEWICPFPFFIGIPNIPYEHALKKT